MWHNTQKILNPKGNHCKRNHLILRAIFVVFLCPISPSWLTRNIKPKCSKSVRMAMRERRSNESLKKLNRPSQRNRNRIMQNVGSLKIENGIRNFIGSYQTNFLCGIVCGISVVLCNSSLQGNRNQMVRKLE